MKARRHDEGAGTSSRGRPADAWGSQGGFMTNVDRRNFLRRTATYTGGILIAPSLSGLIACHDATTPLTGATPRLRRAGKGDGGYGNLVQHPDLPFLLPAGFQMKRLSLAGEPLHSGGGLVPNAHDGMAALPIYGRGPGRFPRRQAGSGGHFRLVRNHEIRDEVAATTLIGSNPYDSLAGGGCTTLEVEIDSDGEPHITEEFVSISGTAVNCAGGPTTWGSWLTCEETTEGTAQGREKEHGYVFEVSAYSDREVDAVPLKDMGRFSHEAVAIDRRYGHIYETEDAGKTSGFYRFIPNIRASLDQGGRLQMLAVKGKPQLDTTAGGIPPLTPMAAEWVDIDDPDPAVITDESSVFAQGLAKGGTRFARLEGCWWGDDSCFFNATSGGAAGAGQVWQYRPRGRNTGELILVFESPTPEVLDSPDNICVSPRGGLVICEDGDGIQLIHGLTTRGQIFDLVSTDSPGNDNTEFAGACFSPDGRILFFNQLGATRKPYTTFGATYALWGPWHEGAL